MGAIGKKLSDFIRKNALGFMALLLGILLLLWGKGTDREKEKHEEAGLQPEYQGDRGELSEVENTLSSLLSGMEGAGKVRVMLSMDSGDETLLAMDTEGEDQKTVLVNQGNSQQSAVTKGLLYGKYRGAIVLAEGADSASVRLQLTEAVSALTGLNAGNICVLKMKGTG